MTRTCSLAKEKSGDLGLSADDNKLLKKGFKTCFDTSSPSLFVKRVPSDLCLESSGWLVKCCFFKLNRLPCFHDSFSLSTLSFQTTFHLFSASNYFYGLLPRSYAELQKGAPASPGTLAFLLERKQA